MYYMHYGVLCVSTCISNFQYAVHEKGVLWKVVDQVMPHRRPAERDQRVDLEWKGMESNI
jgi:hypothetical protein